MSTVVVAGALANKAGSGGEAWVRMSWLRGFARLGFDAYFVEELARDLPGFEEAVTYFVETTRWFGVADRATLLADGEVILGPDIEQVIRQADGAALVNISGHLRSRRLLERFTVRAYVDIDPGFTQFWHADGHDVGLLDHDLHFTIGENIGTGDCPIPTDGIEWRAVRQPVVLDDWPVVPGEPRRSPRYTTVTNWRPPFGAPTFGGRTYELKHHQFRRFIELPQRVGATFELAVAYDPADARDMSALDDHGWRRVDPSPLGVPATFRDYVAGSDGEFSVCQGVYAQTGSGWFSDRTVRYLASGRPAIVQDTGLRQVFPDGAGLLLFDTLDEAVAGVEAVLSDGRGHAEAARAIAESDFSHDRALAPILDCLTS